MEKALPPIPTSFIASGPIWVGNFSISISISATAPQMGRQENGVGDPVPRCGFKMEEMGKGIGAHGLRKKEYRSKNAILIRKYMYFN
jgi:hypothetical protein